MTALPPMKARDLGREIAWGSEDPYGPLAPYFTEAYVAEPKLDGVRIRLTFAGGRCRVQTTSSTGGFDRTANFPHLARLGSPELDGLVLDGELVAATAKMTGFTGVKIDSLLSASTSLVNCLPAASIKLQRRYGAAQVYVFDILAVPGGQPTLRLAYDDRRALLEEALGLLHAQFAGCSVRPVAQLPAAAESITLAIDAGFEGVVLKKRSGTYKGGGRGGEWLKVKTRGTADGYVIGFEPGKDGWANTVGALKLAVTREDGSEWHVASVGNLTAAFREQVTGPDGALRPEWYGRVVEFAAQGLTSGVKARHPFMLRLRPDKTAADCDAAQLDAFPRI